ncbi:hypothetical protein CLV30_101205 [Haloactinopolyspora alba]|uniref:Uncharacterized protein n=1 Tax=Haloactinopolyspora alba TaxID=648780 RepID=A0A2P8EFI8_9ACTN|nr:hypothetical protein [Haloactinopolyspora alba]PSL08235.1 hypothetical protein CLV30_101205 [Haloactinopolyspora alba]
MALSAPLRRLLVTVCAPTLLATAITSAHADPAPAEPAPGTPEPATAPTGAAPGERDGTDVDELKLSNAWVPRSQQLRFGAEPLDYVTDAATRAAGSATCSITANEATAMVIAMTWPEVSPSGAPPSPMTLSRYDTQPSLGDPQNRAPGLWFHPGIGMWQLDSAGLGTDFTAAEAMDTKYAAERMAPFIVDKYCARRADGAGRAAARAHAWTDWVACREGACENTYQRALDGVVTDDSVGRYGGAEPRRCWYRGAAHDCMFVDPAAAQGSDWWAAPGGGRSPVAAPFYVIRLDGVRTTELRYWLTLDSGAAGDVEVVRPFGANARGGLTWRQGPGMCDMTAWRGDC